MITTALLDLVGRLAAEMWERLRRGVERAQPLVFHGAPG
jgi:hypothetical protein